MLIAIIETSSSYGEVALADETRLLARQTLSAEQKHARDLAPALQGLFRTVGRAARELDLILVDVGPGSYTGLRVGLATAKTLAYLTGAAIVGVDAMTVLAEAAPVSAERIDTIVDAQQGLVYAGKYQRPASGAAPVESAAIEIIAATAWAQELPAGAYVTGPALVRYANLVAAGCALADPGDWQPKCAALWATGLRAFQAGRRDDFWTLEPLYLRGSSAEQKWDRRIPKTVSS